MRLACRFAVLVVAACLTGATKSVLADGDVAGKRSFFVTWQAPGTDALIRAVQFAADRRTGWAVGGRGTILATRDGGAHWALQNSGTLQNLEGIDVEAQGKTAWAAGFGGTILATHDGGAHWEKQATGTLTQHLHGIRFAADGETGWAVGDGGAILATRDGGVSWQPQTSGTTRDLYGIHFAADRRTGWAVGDWGTILTTSSGGGGRWEAQVNGDTSDLIAIHFAADRQAGWAVGLNGTILATRDGGVHWQPQTSGTTQDLYGIHFAADKQTGWAVGDWGTILATRDGGVHWQAQTTRTEYHLRGLYVAADEQTGWAVGNWGIILATSDGGVHWTPQTSDTTYDLFGTCIAADGRTGWVVGMSGTILGTRNRGGRWAAQASGTTHNLLGIHFAADGQTGWAVGDGGAILVTHNGGEQWQPQTSGTPAILFGIDFAADRQAGWALGTSGTILSTRDGGASWKAQVSGTTNLLIGVHFVADGQAGWAVGMSGTILATSDGGASWKAQVSGTTNNLIGVHFAADGQTGWAVGTFGTILATRDGGASWKAQVSGTTNNLIGVHFAADGQTGWAVGTFGTILATRDGGARWELQYSGTGQELNGIDVAADGKAGWAVGRGGKIVRASPPTLAPILQPGSFATTTAWTAGAGTIELRFALQVDPKSPVRSATVLARNSQLAAWTPIGEARRRGAQDQWVLPWKPAVIGVHSGDDIFYAVLVNDGLPPPAPLVLGMARFDPVLTRLWRDDRSGILGVGVPLAVLAIYLLGFGAALLVAPARLARVGALPDEGLSATGNLAFVFNLARHLVETFTLPWLCRLPRVRRAWTAEFRAGASRLSDLGKTARADFVTQPDVLDAWVEARLPRVLAALDGLDLFAQRGICVDVPLRVGSGAAARIPAPIIEHPSPASLRPAFARERAVVTVVGTGGSGKSTLACAIARWAMEDNVELRLLPHRMIPVFIIEDTVDLATSIIRTLRAMLGDGELPEDLVTGLLSQQRLLVVIDALSERDAATQKHVGQVFADHHEFNAVLITARREPQLQAIERTQLYPLLLDAKHIVPFIIDYVARLHDVADLQDGHIQLRLAAQVLAIAETGGIQTPVTPLLVTLFVQSARARARSGITLDTMPQDVPEIFIDYLRRVDAARRDGAAVVGEDPFVTAAQILAETSLGTNLVPGDVTPDEAVQALAKAGFADDAGALLDRLVFGGIIEKREPGGIAILRFGLDPVAEYLAAIRGVAALRRKLPAEVAETVAAFTQAVPAPAACEGYLRAFATCYRAYRPTFRLPELAFSWEGSPDDIVKTAR